VAPLKVSVAFDKAYRSLFAWCLQSAILYELSHRFDKTGSRREPRKRIEIRYEKVRDLVRILESKAWRLKTTRGSHRQFLHLHKGMVVTVPGQQGKDVPTGTLRAILRSAEIDPKEVQ